MLGLFEAFNFAIGSLAPSSHEVRTEIMRVPYCKGAHDYSNAVSKVGNRVRTQPVELLTGVQSYSYVPRLGVN